VTHAASQRAQCLATLDVLVIAGGLGTRIKSALGDTPKLLAPIAGRPYLAYLLDWLRRFGAKRIVLGLGHQAQAVIDFFRRHEPIIEERLARKQSVAVPVKMPEGMSKSHGAVVVDFCHMLINANEFVYTN